MARAPRQVPDQPRQRGCQTSRRALCDDRPGRDRQRQAGPDRGQLGLARPAAPDRLMNANAVARARDARDVMIEAMMIGDAIGRAGRGDRAFGHDRIICRAKVSGVRDLVDVYRILAARSDYPLHLGPDRGGDGRQGDRRLDGGPRDPAQRGDRRHDPGLADPGPWRPPRTRGRDRPAGPPVDGPPFVPAAGLRLPGLRSDHLDLLPGDGPADPDLSEGPDARVEGDPPGAEEMRVAVMGCVVNGPGETKHADIGISLPGTFEDPVAPVFIDGKLDRTLRGEGLVDEFIDLLEAYVVRRYPAPKRSPRPQRAVRIHRGRVRPATRPFATGGRHADPGREPVGGVAIASRRARSTLPTLAGDDTSGAADTPDDQLPGSRPHGAGEGHDAVPSAVSRWTVERRSSRDAAGQLRHGTRRTCPF